MSQIFSSFTAKKVLKLPTYVLSQDWLHYKVLPYYSHLTAEPNYIQGDGYHPPKEMNRRDIDKIAHFGG